MRRRAVLNSLYKLVIIIGANLPVEIINLYTLRH